MSQYELYTLFLCIIVLLALTVVFSLAILYIARLTVKLIRSGAEDEKIQKEYKKQKENKSSFMGTIDKGITLLFCAVLCLFFVISLYINFTGDALRGDIPALKVVNSGSMASKYEDNDYLFENDLNDQFFTFDVIVTHKLPDEFDLKLYDIVVYEVDDILLVHRIVGIEEPNAKHPDQRYFLLQGDAVQYPDRFPVKYSQMRSIYKGQRIPFVGSFIVFLQSPAGYLCVILVLLAVVTMPLLERKIEEEKKLRLALLARKKEARQAAVISKPSPVLPTMPVSCPKKQAPVVIVSLPENKIVVDEKGVLVAPKNAENSQKPVGKA